MAISKNAQRERYVDYTEHCLKLAKQTTDRESRMILREMATEWLKLAEMASAPEPQRTGYRYFLKSALSASLPKRKAGELPLSRKPVERLSAWSS